MTHDALTIGLLAREAMNHVPLLSSEQAITLAQQTMSQYTAHAPTPQLYLRLCDDVVERAYSLTGIRTEPPPSVIRTVTPIGDRDNPVTITPLAPPPHKEP